MTSKTMHLLTAMSMDMTELLCLHPETIQAVFHLDSKPWLDQEAVLEVNPHLQGEVRYLIEGIAKLKPFTRAHLPMKGGTVS